MSLIALLNVLLGAICGLWFRVQILIPLLAVALVEVGVLKRTETWSAAFWSAIVLIISLEMGYLIGSALASVWLPSARGSIGRDVTMRGHGGLSHHG